MTIACEHKLSILARNDIIGATVTANRSVVNSDYPLTNLKNELRVSTARWGGTANVQITVTPPEVGMLNFIGLFGSNLSPLGTIIVQVYDGEHGSGNRVHWEKLNAQGFIPLGIWRAGIDPYAKRYTRYADDRLVSRLSSNKAWRSATITISDTANPDGYIELRYIMLGEDYTFQRHFDFGETFTQLGDTLFHYAASGAILAAGRRPKAKKLVLPLVAMTLADHSMLTTMEEQYGDYPWYLMAGGAEDGTAATNYAFIGRAQQMQYSRYSDKLYSTTLTIEEV